MSTQGDHHLELKQPPANSQSLSWRSGTDYDDRTRPHSTTYDLQYLSARQHESRHTGEARLGRTHRSDEDSVRQGAGAARRNLRIPAETHEALELRLERRKTAARLQRTKLGRYLERIRVRVR
eukprot:scaffold25393_cov36-Phaeocystis_antarctica.AAC.1